MQFIFFIRYTFLFFLFTIIGTLSHEMGHWLVARCLGYDARVHFASTEIAYEQDSSFQKMIALQNANSKAILLGEDFPNSARYKELSSAFWRKNSFILWGGVIQTLLVSFVCSSVIWRRKKRKVFPDLDASYFNLSEGLLVLGALFILRPLFNFIPAIPGLIQGNMHFNSDEYKLATWYSLPPLLLMIIFSVFGFLVLSWIVFWVVPHAYRRAFCLAGIIGGLSGFFIWMMWLGQLLIP